MRVLELVAAVLLPLIVLGFIVAERFGLSDWLFGHGYVLQVASRFETSYATDIDRQVGPDEEAWKPLLRLIRKYSTANLPADKQPMVLARNRALASGYQKIGPDIVAEWTSPATPMILIYSEWPGNTVPREDTRIVGTIGDLRSWVERSRSDFRFLVQDLLLTIIAAGVALFLWLSGNQAKSRSESGSASGTKEKSV
jgi:hypothetical protein